MESDRGEPSPVRGRVFRGGTGPLMGLSFPLSSSLMRQSRIISLLQPSLEDRILHSLSAIPGQIDRGEWRNISILGSLVAGLKISSRIVTRRIRSDESPPFVPGTANQ